MIDKISLVIFISGHLLFYNVNAQSAKSFNPQQLKEDYQVLINTLKEAYPSLYRYNDQQVIDAFLREKKAAHTSSMTEKQFFSVIAQTVTMIKDEHVIATPSASYYAENKATSRYLPFSLTFIANRMFVNRSTVASLKRGEEIISINGIPTKKYWRKLFHICSMTGTYQPSHSDIWKIIHPRKIRTCSTFISRSSFRFLNNWL
jgi:hypothetical protein